MSDTTKHDRYKRELDCRFCRKTWTEWFYPARPTRPFHVCAECTSRVAHHEASQRKLRAIAAIKGLH